MHTPPGIHRPAPTRRARSRVSVRSASDRGCAGLATRTGGNAAVVRSRRLRPALCPVVCQAGHSMPGNALIIDTFFHEHRRRAESVPHPSPEFSVNWGRPGQRPNYTTHPPDCDALNCHVHVSERKNRKSNSKKRRAGGADSWWPTVFSLLRYGSHSHNGLTRACLVTHHLKRSSLVSFLLPDPSALRRSVRYFEQTHPKTQKSQENQFTT